MGSGGIRNVDTLDTDGPTRNRKKVVVVVLVFVYEGGGVGRGVCVGGLDGGGERRERVGEGWEGGTT